MVHQSFLPSLLFHWIIFASKRQRRTTHQTQWRLLFTPWALQKSYRRRCYKRGWPLSRMRTNPIISNVLVRNHEYILYVFACLCCPSLTFILPKLSWSSVRFALPRHLFLEFSGCRCGSLEYGAASTKNYMFWDKTTRNGGERLIERVYLRRARSQTRRVKTDASSIFISRVGSVQLRHHWWADAVY